MYLPTTLTAMADVYFLYYSENGLTEIPAEWNEGWIRGDCRCPEHAR